MRISFAVVLWLASGCGRVQDHPLLDAARPDAPSIDAPAGSCSVHDTITSCGASCATCSVTSERELPSCDATACGHTCKASAPTCSDQSCSRLVWNFDSGMLDGITPRLPANLVLAVRMFQGTNQLAIDVIGASEVSFTVPVCLGGNVSLAGKTLSANVFINGGDTQPGADFVQSSVPSPMNGAFLTQQAVTAGQTQVHMIAINNSSFAAMATTVTFQIGAYGTPITGTIYVDDITIQ